MQDLTGKTAVITGGASGMGKSFATRFAAAGMNIVLADIEEPALDATVAELTEAGASVVGVVGDVGKRADHTALMEATNQAFGAAHLVCLNAGVGGGNGRIDTLTTEDWEWTLNVNLWGIIHGLAEFLPALKEQDDGHVLITASVAGHLSYPSMGPYNVTKHAAVTIAETLYAELRDDGSQVGVTCLCPGLVMTNIFMSDRNRPEHLSTPILPEEPTAEEQQERAAMLDLVIANAKSPDHVADLVHQAVLDKSFWVFTDEDFTPAMNDRLDSIRNRQPPPARESLLTIYD